MPIGSSTSLCGQCFDLGLLQLVRFFDGLEKTLCSGPTLPSSIQDLAEKCMQLWTEINVVALHKLIEMMPRQMRAVIKAKGGPTKY